MNQEANSDQDANSEAGASRLGMVLDGLTVLAFGLLVILPVVFEGWSEERERWQLARVHESLLAGDLGQAETGLAELDLENLKGDPGSLLSAAEAMIRIGRYEEALGVCNGVEESGFLYILTEGRGRKLKDKAELSSFRLAARFVEVKSDCLNFLGREGEALKLIEKRYQTMPQFNTTATRKINHLAYQRALAGIELGAAIRTAKELVNSKGPPPEEDKVFSELPFVIRSAISCAIIEYNLPEAGASGPRPAESELTRVIAAVESKRSEKLGGLFAQIYRQMNRAFPLTIKAERRLGSTRRSGELIAYQEAMMRLCRALIYQRQGNEEARIADLKQVAELGYDHDELIEELPSLDSCIEQVSQTAMFADTLGFVYSQMGEYRMAANWFELAIASGEYSLRLESSPLLNRYTETRTDPRKIIWLKTRMLATLYSHRKTVFEQTNHLKEAAADRGRIKQLGFENAILF